MRAVIPAWIVAALLLVACGDGGCAASGRSDTESQAATAASAQADGSQEAGCAAAFGDLTAEEATAAVEEGSDELDRTVMACDSVEEWQTYYTELVGDSVSAAEQLTFIEGRCRANPELARVNACPDARSS